MVSGLRVNFHKSVVRSVGISQLDKLVYSKCLNCRQIEIPFKYLDMTIRGNSKRSEFWNPIVDKIRYRLSKCKADCYLWQVGFILLSQLLVFFPCSTSHSLKHLWHIQQNQKNSGKAPVELGL